MIDQVQDEKRSRRPFLVIDELVRPVGEKIKESRNFTISAISKSLTHKVVTVKLGFGKHCARWVGSVLDFLTRCDNGGEHFLRQIVTGDETWIVYDSPETKRQSVESKLARQGLKPSKSGHLEKLYVQCFEIDQSFY